MRILYFDSVGGASGDMILGALIDLGVDPTRLEADLKSLELDAWHLDVQKASEKGITGTRVHVRIEEKQAGHHHVGLREIRAKITASDLPDPVKEQAISVFERLAAAEAKVHGSTVEEIHFHEVGAVDSIVDIVGGCLALHRLEIDDIAVAPLPAGQGTIACAHGTYPNPPPAVIELLQGHPTLQTDLPFELVTPTGAVLLTSWKSVELPLPPATAERSGYGFGHFDLPGRANLLRATVMTVDDADRAENPCLVLETNIDDMSPEWAGALAERLLGEGALDVFILPVQMKKFRPGYLLTVLCEPSDRERLVDMVFAESTTFGIREYLVRRSVLDRKTVDIQTDFGSIPVKVGIWKGRVVTCSPEIDDCVRAAAEKGIPVRQVYEEAKRNAEAEMKGQNP